MALWQLDYNGTTKTFAEWGISVDMSFDFSNKLKHTVKLRTIEGFDAVAQFDYDGSVIIYQPDGAVWFQGYCDAPTRITSGGREAIQYQVHNAWWLFERLTFKQARKMVTHFASAGDPTSATTTTDVFTSEVFLGETATGAYQTNGQQMVEIINWVNECWNPTKQGATVGRLDAQDVVSLPASPGTAYPQVNAAKSRGNDLFCSDAMANVLRPSPDRVLSWDYSTSPATLNCIALAAAAEVTIDITSEQERKIQLSPQNNRQLAGVLIHYIKGATVDGVTVPQVTVDKYPGSINEYTPDVSTHTIEIAGSVLNLIYANVKVTPIADAVSGTGSVRKAFWKLFDSTLTSDHIDDTTLTVDAAASVVLESDGVTGVNLTNFPNVLLHDSASLTPWMTGVNSVLAIVKAPVSCKKYIDSTKKIQDAQKSKSEHQVKVTLTNAITQTYSAALNRDTGDAIPTGVAQAVYDSVADLQYAGQIEFVDAQMRQDIFVGCKLKLIGPTHIYTNLLVQSLSGEPHAGRITVRYGPSSVLDVQQRVELALMSSRRIVYNMPSNRATGLSNGGDGAQFGNKHAKDNTTQLVGNLSQLASVADTTGLGTNAFGSDLKSAVVHDPISRELRIEVLVPGTGARVSNAGGLGEGAVSIKLTDLFGSDNVYHEAKFYELPLCVSDGEGGFTTKHALFLMTDVF